MMSDIRIWWTKAVLPVPVEGRAPEVEIRTHPSVQSEFDQEY